MAHPTEPTGTVQALLDWAAQAASGRVLRAAPLAGGNRRRSWAVDVQASQGGVQALFLRFASEPNPEEDPYDLRREARLYQALMPTGVRLPRIAAEHPTLPAILMERLAGESALRACGSEAERQATARDFMRELHRLHSLDAGTLGLGPVGSMEHHVHEELRIWWRMYTSVDRPDPLLEAAFLWLKHHVPRLTQAAVLVHGDAGPGNFLFSDGQVTGLIDWELWHFGDPVEDIAWLSMRSVLEPFPPFAQRVREYEMLSGAPLDRQRLLYHRIFVTLRVAVIRHRAGSAPAPDSDPGNSLVSRLLNRRLLADGLSQALGHPVTTLGLPAVPPSPRAPDYAYLIDHMRQLLPLASDDPILARRIKGMARVLKHLQAQDHLGARFAGQEHQDLEAVLAAPPGSLEEGRHALALALRRGEIGLPAAWPCLQRQVARESHLGAGALGQLSHRGFETLET